MKVAPWYLPKSFLVRQINKRNLNAMNERVIVADNVNPEDAMILNVNKEHLGRFARRNHVQLSFSKGEGLYGNATDMSINKEHCTYYRATGLPMYLVSFNPKRRVVLPNSENSGKFLSSIKAETKSALAACKDESNLTLTSLAERVQMHH